MDFKEELAKKAENKNTKPKLKSCPKCGCPLELMKDNNHVGVSNDSSTYIQAKARIHEELKAYCMDSEVSNSLNFLAKEYWDCETIKFLMDVIKNYRADNLKEAINLYEDYLHKAKVEAMQNKQLLATENLTNVMGGQIARMEELSKIAKSADRAAKLSE